MEDKTFELITKMYSEMTDQFQELNRKLDKKADNSHIVRLENELTPKVEALLDGYKQIAEGQKELKDQISDFRAKFENHDIQIVALKSKKKAAR